MITLQMKALALGTMNFGKRTSEGEARRIVDRALELGIAVLDTANVYNDGESERIVGRVLGERRAAVRIASKAGLARIGGKPEGLAKDTLVRACEDKPEAPRHRLDRPVLFSCPGPSHAHC